MKEIIKTNRYDHLISLFKENNLVLLSGASTSGKNFISNWLIKNNSEIVRVKSITTRPSRPDEKQDTYYEFVNKDEFAKKDIIHPYEFPENTGNMYGYEKKELLDKLNSGKKILLIVSPEAIEFYQKYLKTQNINFKSVYWFINQTIVESRYCNRLNIKDPILLPAEKREDLIARMHASADDQQFFDLYDYVIDASEKIELK